jgi:hypothetical protein
MNICAGIWFFLSFIDVHNTGKVWIAGVVDTDKEFLTGVNDASKWCFLKI